MYKKNSGSWLKHIDFIMLDIMCQGIALVLAYIIRHGMENPLEVAIYRNMFYILLLLNLVAGFISSNYKNIIRRGYYIEFKKTIQYVTIIIVGMFVYMFFSQSSKAFSRLVFIYMWILSCLFCYVIRTLWKIHIRKRVAADVNRRSVIAVTTKNKAEEMMELLEAEQYRNYDITGIILLDGDEEKYEGRIPIAASKDDIFDYMCEHVVDEVFFNLPENMSLPENMIEGCELLGIPIHITLPELGELNGDKTVGGFAGYVVVTASPRIVSAQELFYKRVMDIIGAVIGLLITGIITIIVAPVIKIQSPGPVFFIQERIGRNGRPFKLYKFRSMYVDAERRKEELLKYNEMQGPMFKLKDDPRIFPFGKIMRSFSIDEFPQFFNVLKGDMSLVGTRPPTADEYAQYELHHKRRLTMKPGITGLWQVSGRSDVPDFEKIVMLDTQYIMNWDIGMDLRILFKTFPAIWKKEGAR